MASSTGQCQMRRCINSSTISNVGLGTHLYGRRMYEIADRLAGCTSPPRVRVQFPLNKPIPKALVVEMVKLRLSQLQE